jgi:hypothetical protein
MARGGRSVSQPVAAELLLVLAVALCAAARRTSAIGVNWGTQLSHQLPASTVVRLLQDNGFDKVKLFDAEDTILGALKGSGIQVMVGIPNDLLADLAAGGKAADNWVAKNVSGHVRDGVDIRSVTLISLLVALHYITYSSLFLIIVNINNYLCFRNASYSYTVKNLNGHLALSSVVTITTETTTLFSLTSVTKLFFFLHTSFK